jgi:hypothetical protein
MERQAVKRGGMDWMDLNQDRNRWQGVVKVVMNLLVASIAGNFLTR